MKSASAKKQVVVIGDGGWGTALALVAQANGHAVRVWGPFAEYLDQVRAQRENIKFLAGVPLPADIEWTHDFPAALAGAEVVVLAVPSKFSRAVLTKMKPALAAQAPSALILSVTKGFDSETGHRMSPTAEEILGVAPVAALSGPSLAPEVARGVPTAVTIACADHGRAKHLQAVFNSKAFRVYTSDDVVGVEVGGALKNIIAIAAGISDGIGFGDNSKAALITRGLAEISRLGVAMGAHPETFAGLSGMGDLVVTCMSTLSRNHKVGERLGRGEKMDDILKSMEQVAEGVWTCTTARELARKQKVAVPIIDEVHAVIYEGKNPRKAVEALMSREPKPERDR